MIHIIRIFLHAAGIDDTTGPWYAFWSGFAGDLTLFGAFGAFYHKHNCHVKRCPRIGKHIYDGTPFCAKHHPEGR